MSNSQTVQKNLIAFKTKSSTFWRSQGETMAIRLFHNMANRVPAYRDFLKINKVNPNKIKNILDFASIPTIDKNNYLRKYPLPLLCWDGKFSGKNWVISATSGSTGEPFYFPRQDAQDEQYAQTAESYLRTNFQIHKRKTLYINGFAMGVWIGGLFTYQAIKSVAESKKYALSIINPGINKKEIFSSIKILGGFFDQIIIGGYPPFIKDIVDDAKSHGVSWQKHNVGFIFSAEAFSEGFRDYVAKKTGLRNVFLQTLNHYGTVDLGTMAHETALSILVRRLALKNKNLYRSIFQNVNRLPTLAQYDPRQFYFEERNGGLLCSANSGLPLVRYDLKDNGGIFAYEDVERKFLVEKIKLKSVMKKSGLQDTLWYLPFVYVYERSDMVVSWYGANIYPEHIREAHQHGSLQKHLTGKFVMQLGSNANHNPVLYFTSELRKGILPIKSLKKKLLQHILTKLLEKNSEFRNSYEALPKRKRIIRVNLSNYEDPKYFRSGGKQKWTIK